MLNKAQLFFVIMSMSYSVWAENATHPVPTNQDTIIINGIVQGVDTNTGNINIQDAGIANDTNIKVPDNSTSIQPHQETTPPSYDEIGFHIYEIPDNPIWMQPNSKNSAVIIYNNAANHDDKKALKLPKKSQKKVKRKILETIR